MAPAQGPTANLRNFKPLYIYVFFQLAQNVVLRAKISNFGVFWIQIRDFWTSDWLFSANSNPKPLKSVSYKNYKNHKNLEANLHQLSEPPARQNRLSPYPWDYQLIYIKLMNHAYNQWPVSARTIIFLWTKLLGVKSSLTLIACGESSPKGVNNKDIDTWCRAHINEGLEKWTKIF